MNGILNFLKKNWYWVAAVVLLIVVVVMTRRNRRKKEEEELAKKSLLYGTGNTADPQGLTEAKYPLRPEGLAGGYSAEKGSMGTQIQFLQQLYNDNLTSGTPLAADGKYGPKTLGAFLGYFGNEIASNGVITEAQYDQIVKNHVK